MIEALDLPAYLARIDWSGAPLKPDQQTLGALIAAHTAHIPFENLDVLLGRPPRLDLASLQVKLVRGRRGGYCFEQATLFAAVLEAIGFRVARHTARVVLSAPRHAAPRTHMFLVVTLPDGRRVVADPGFGSLVARLPVPLDGTPTATHRVVRDGPYHVLQAGGESDWIDAWVTTLDVDHPIDFELGNHYTATHPDSPFVNRLMFRAFVPGGRVTLMNREVTRRADGTQGSTVTLPDRRALRLLLAELMGVDLPEVEGLRVPTIQDWCDACPAPSKAVLPAHVPKP